MAGLAIAGLAIAGFNAATTAGLAIAGLAMAGLAIAGLAIAGLAIAGLAMAGLAIAGLCVSADRTVGFVNPKLSGSRSRGAAGSGLSVTNPCKPPETSVPPGALISWALVVTLAVGFADWMNTDRAILEFGAMVTSSEVSGLNCNSEACPCGSTCPFTSAGWFAMEIRKLLCRVVVFRKVTVNARSRSCVGFAAEKPSGFEFPRDPTTSPGATMEV